MTIRASYFEYLGHLGKTCTIREFFKQTDRENLVALRHDVDFCLNTALEMGFWEAQHGIQSTYYLLHTADYWSDPKLTDKCLQLQDFGHEIGLHVNVLTEWMQGKIESPQKRLEELLSTLRNSGVQVTGVSAHGDACCYEKQFINYWCFRELKPEQPEITEDGLSAEGIFVTDESKRIHYPSMHQLVRDDGSVFPLWSVSMAELGLQYDATHTQYDTYFTDSGGSWKRSPDPLDCDLSRGRHMVLIHPIYWRDEQKKYFILSTARSGSKWLSTILQKATPVRAAHEFTLNHRYQEDQLVVPQHKNTGEGFSEFMMDHDQVRRLLLEARVWMESFPEDYVEANVYLPHVWENTRKIFPDVELVHLYRNPRDVVRSILNRNWYDTPSDTKHPRFDITGWEELNPFEKACWYVRKTNELLLELCPHSIQFERMVSDQAYLQKKLLQLGIPFYPRLAQGYFEKRINENYSDVFPDYGKWSKQQKAYFHHILDTVNYRLGYVSFDVLLALKRIGYLGLLFFCSLRQKLLPDKQTSSREILAETDFINQATTASSLRCLVEHSEKGLYLRPVERESHAHLILGGGTWRRIKSQKGWKASIGNYYQCQLDFEMPENGLFFLFCLQYDQNGDLLAHRQLGKIDDNGKPCTFTFRPRPDTARFDLAVYMPNYANLDWLILKRFELTEVGLATMA